MGHFAFHCKLGFCIALLYKMCFEIVVLHFSGDGTGHTTVCKAFHEV